MLNYIVHIAISLFPLSPIKRCSFTLTFNEGLPVNEGAKYDNQKHEYIDRNRGEREKPAGLFSGVSGIY